MNEFLNVISLGAGRQSSYMLLNALEGKFTFKPDFAIFADTGCEPLYVYSFLNWLESYVKNHYNFNIIRVSKGNLKEDIQADILFKKRPGTQIPLRIGTDGYILQRQCTRGYKLRPIHQYLQKIRNHQRIRMWIGISSDEVERIKTSPVQYITNYYPLVEHRISISEIKNWFEISGFKVPGKSACTICPFHTIQYWKRFKKSFPEEFESVYQFDDLIRFYPGLKDNAYISSQKKNLRSCDFEYTPSLFPELIEDCDGLCGL